MIGALRSDDVKPLFRKETRSKGGFFCARSKVRETSLNAVPPMTKNQAIAVAAAITTIVGAIATAVFAAPGEYVEGVAEKVAADKVMRHNVDPAAHYQKHTTIDASINTILRKQTYFEGEIDHIKEKVDKIDSVEEKLDRLIEYQMKKDR